jgi:hypothetical protein
VFLRLISPWTNAERKPSREDEASAILGGILLEFRNYVLVLRDRPGAFRLGASSSSPATCCCGSAGRISSSAPTGLDCSSSRWATASSPPRSSAVYCRSNPTSGAIGRRARGKLIEGIRKWVNFGYDEVIDPDLKSYFDTIDQELSVKLVHARCRPRAGQAAGAKTARTPFAPSAARRSRLEPNIAVRYNVLRIVRCAKKPWPGQLHSRADRGRRQIRRPHLAKRIDHQKAAGVRNDIHVIWRAK